MQAIWSAFLSPVATFGNILLSLTAKPVKSCAVLQGNFAPIEKDVDLINVSVSGKVPSDLINGAFLRNGPNPKYHNDGNLHWFDGDGMLHGVLLSDVNAYYNAKFILTDRFLEEQRLNGNFQFMRVGWFESRSGIIRFMWNSLLQLTGYAKTLSSTKSGQANTALECFEGRILALHEASLPFHVKVESKNGNIESVGHVDFNNTLRHNCTAHPKIDPFTGELRLFGYDATSTFIRYSAIKNDIVINTRKLDLQRTIMMHDFGITKNYSVILDFPLVFDFKQLSKGKNPVDYRPDLPARIGLAPKESGETIWFSVETCYCFHLLNCWESKNSKNEIEVTVIGCRLPDFNLTTYHQSSPTRPYLWKLNVTTGIVVEKVLFDGLNYGTDFPRCSPKLQGLETRFGFFTLFTPNAPTPDAIGVLKLDLVTLKYSTILFGDSKHGGEVYFQPKKDAKTEDDGYLMTFVHDDLNPNVGELWIMDSKSMAKEPICKVLIPRRVPYGFHCRWVTKEELESQSIYYDN